MKVNVNIQGDEDIKSNILYIINISMYYVKSIMVILYVPSSIVIKKWILFVPENMFVHKKVVVFW